MFGNIQRERPQIMQAVLTVKRKHLLSPHYIRIVLKGEDVRKQNTAIELPDFQCGSGGIRPTMCTYS